MLGLTCRLFCDLYPACTSRSGAEPLGVFDVIQLVKASSILGLRPSGVELLADALLREGLSSFITPRAPLLVVDDLNCRYSTERDISGMMNSQPLRDFSVRLKETVTRVVRSKRLPVVLGGDCSILLGILSGLKASGTYGLVTLDAHSDFYLPSQSSTGEAADMDVALVTGRGPSVLTDIDGLGPYVDDSHVIHVGQRDQEETLRYGASQISQTAITCYGLDAIRSEGVEAATRHILADMGQIDVAGFWLHIDTDVINDEDNPAVDYRLPDGLRFSECEHLLSRLMKSGSIAGLSVAIYNPRLDPSGLAGRAIAQTLRKALV